MRPNGRLYRRLVVRLLSVRLLLSGFNPGRGMKKFVSLMFFVALLILGEQGARACTCVTSGEVAGGIDLKRWLKEFDGAMFTGHVAGIERVTVNIDEGLSIPELKVTFKVERFWKGVDTAEVAIYTGVDGAACGVRYVEGERYFVIAHRLRGGLHTDICTSPEKYSDVEAYSKELGGGNKPKARRRRV
jgi:hypothetical protein